MSRFEGTSCFGTGETFDYRVVKSEYHTDPMNDSDPGNDHSPTLTMMVPVVYYGVSFYVRIGMNIYRKKCCSDAMDRLAINESILHMIKTDSDSSGVLKKRGLHRKFAQPSDNPSAYVWAYPADDDKDGMLSLYVNTLNDDVENICMNHSGRDRAFLIEALLIIPLTPAPDGWWSNTKEAVRQLLESNGDLGKSYYCCYIDVALERSGTVSSGLCQQNQVCHRGCLTMHQLFSCRKLDSCLQLADAIDDTKYVLKSIEASVDKGGVDNVGAFYAQMLLNIATKLGML